jgi:hypothetical protein
MDSVDKAFMVGNCFAVWKFMMELVDVAIKRVAG